MKTVETCQESYRLPRRFQSLKFRLLKHLQTFSEQLHIMADHFRDVFSCLLMTFLCGGATTVAYALGKDHGKLNIVAKLMPDPKYLENCVSNLSCLMQWNTISTSIEMLLQDSTRDFKKMEEKKLRILEIKKITKKTYNNTVYSHVNRYKFVTLITFQQLYFCVHWWQTYIWQKFKRSKNQSKMWLTLADLGNGNGGEGTDEKLILWPQNCQIKYRIAIMVKFRTGHKSDSNWNKIWPVFYPIWI